MSDRKPFLVSGRIRWVHNGMVESLERRFNTIAEALVCAFQSESAVVLRDSFVGQTYSKKRYIVEFRWPEHAKCFWDFW